MNHTSFILRGLAILSIAGCACGIANGQTLDAGQAQQVMTVVAGTGGGVSTMDGGKTWQVVAPGTTIEQLQGRLARKISAEHQGSAQARVGRTAAFPNPATESVSIRYQLEAPGEVDVMLHDSRGNEVLRAFEGPRATGEHQLQLDMTTLPDGVYYYRIVSSGAITAGSTVVVLR